MSHRHAGSSELEVVLTQGDTWVRPGPRGDYCVDCADRETCLLERPYQKCPRWRLRAEPAEVR